MARRQGRAEDGVPVSPRARAVLLYAPRSTVTREWSGRQSRELCALFQQHKYGCHAAAMACVAEKAAARRSVFAARARRYLRAGLLTCELYGGFDPSPSTPVIDAERQAGCDMAAPPEFDQARCRLELIGALQACADNRGPRVLFLHSPSHVRATVGGAVNTAICWD